MNVGPQCFGWKVVYSFAGTNNRAGISNPRRNRCSFATQNHDDAVEYFRAIMSDEYRLPGLAVTLYEKTRPSGGWRTLRRYKGRPVSSEA